ncbi:MAG: dephospho-CoA kinase [Nitrospirae bacterium]|nr:MAG: dephospho-CoA kinase [Nitrospirae bacterium 13_2_20CM_2_62_8]TLY41380.1 MAG: dephospho-CoA kinase [Nitrospirota bacterium]TLY43321.1 MAG: dephospho-CoA kinase [Nitrospirota bacterium]
MIVVGLTGGLATGKSSVARLFQDCGAIVIDADVLAREAVEPGRPAWRDIVRVFGKKVLQPDRALDRRTLGRIVFGNRAKMKQLNAIVHPRVAREQNRLTREITSKELDAVIIYDAPVLIEAGAHNRMNKIIVVAADQATQIKRLCNRSHFSRAEALRRIRSQLPLAQKIKLADYVIDGTLSFEQTKNEVQRIYAQLEQLA